MRQLKIWLGLAFLAVGLTACASRAPAPVEYRVPPMVDTAGKTAPQITGAQTPKSVPNKITRRPVVDNPREIKVGASQTLFDIAEQYRVPVRAIIEINGLTPPFDLKTGQVLTLPQPLTYKVQRGDTLAGVARRFSIDGNSLGVLNSLSRPFTLQSGQVLALPSLARDSGPNPEASGATPGYVPASPVRVVQTPAKPATAPVKTPVTTKPAAPVVAASKGKFIWPVKGRVISTYGPKGPGQRNDGLNISAREGDPVHAAREGTVVYSGSEIASFGNLILVRHPDGWVTAYAHLSKMVAKEGQKVKQGQLIGNVGKTGNVTEPQLHFETRLNARPVDPAPQLPTS